MLSPFLILLTLITGAVAQDVQPPKRTDPAATPAATIVLTGRVVYDDTGQPATRHRVQLIPSEALLNAHAGLRIPTVVTNERGEFSFQHANAGEYYVIAEPIDARGTQLNSILIRSGDAAADTAKLEHFKKNNLRISVDGQRNVEVNLRVSNPHFGTISGTVFDASHQPAARATVNVVSKNPDAPGKSLRTDDQGRYEVRGLARGEYTVSAHPPSKERDDGERTIGFQGALGATYFPSTLLLQDSPPVVVVPDVDTSNVDVTLISRALRNISGTVRMRGDNHPVTSATLRLSVRQITDPTSDTSKAVVEGPMSNYISSTDSRGRWSISNVPDGSYRLFVEPKQIPPTTRFVQLEQDLKIDGADIEDLVIEVSEGARLSGTVTLEGSGSPQLIDVTATSHQLKANSVVTMNEAGKFTLTGVAIGEIVVSAFARPEDKFYVKSIEANGLDLLRNNMTVGESAEIKDVRIVVSSAVGVITGRVLSQMGDKPVAAVNVMLRRTGDDKLRLWGGKITTVTDERGVFTLTGAPGNYFLIAWRTADGLGAALDRAKREQGPGITLFPNSRKEIDIRLP
jgi:5-hydroxyisourate hydrolase-like protein (transthyretin family)